MGVLFLNTYLDFSLLEKEEGGSQYCKFPYTEGKSAKGGGLCVCVHALATRMNFNLDLTFSCFSMAPALLYL